MIVLKEDLALRTHHHRVGEEVVAGDRPLELLVEADQLIDWDVEIQQPVELRGQCVADDEGARLDRAGVPRAKTRPLTQVFAAIARQRIAHAMRTSFERKLSRTTMSVAPAGYFSQMYLGMTLAVSSSPVLTLMPRARARARLMRGSPRTESFMG